MRIPPPGLVNRFVHAFSDLPIKLISTADISSVVERCDNDDFTALPVIICISSPADLALNMGIDERTSRDFICEINHRVSVGLSQVFQNESSPRKLVVFQLGDYEETLPAFADAIVFKNSARSESSDVPFPYIVGKPVSFLGEKQVYDVTFRGTVGNLLVRQNMISAVEGLNPKLFRVDLRYDNFSQYLDNEVMYRFEYARSIHQSTFVLCPRGTGLSSYRFFETLSYGRIPVLIADGYKLPLEEQIDWSAFVVRVPENNVSRLGQYLEEFLETHDLAAASEASQGVFTKYFSDDNISRYIAEAIKRPL